MQLSQPSDPGTTQTQVQHGLVYRHITLPILALLRMGATPEKLAWSIAVGFIIGVNPVIGSTTVLCLLVALVFRLNVAASQVGNHLTYPLQFLLLLPFIRLGSHVFHTAPLPLSPKELLHLARTSPLVLTRLLWLWEWHAFVVWIGFAAVAIPVAAIILTPLLRQLMRRVEQHRHPILTDASQTR